jgi:regulator of protease activity HflC (stomatin/prohibitin superfamily)
MWAIFWIILGGLGVLIAVIAMVVNAISNDENAQMTAIISGVAGVIFFLFLFPCGCQIIDAGEVGVQVIFGKVDEKPMLSGWNGKSVFGDVHTYSIRLREYTMSISPTEGQKKGGDSVSIRTSDNSEVNIDCTIWWRIVPSQVFYIYQNIAQSQESLEDLVIRPSSRSAIQISASNYSLANIMEQKAGFSSSIIENITSSIKDKGLIVDKVLIRSIIPPKEIDDAIKIKLASQQQLEQKRFELEKAKKDAEIRVVDAEGLAKAQAIINQSLTPNYLQHEAIAAYTKLAGSPNTTFIFCPTSPNGTGLPIILGGAK